jgi:hypothetical protein
MWRAASAVVLFVFFGACLCWSIVAVITGGHVVAAVACMCAFLVSSFGMLMCFLARARPAPARRIEVVAARSDVVKDVRSPRARHVACSETALVCVAVECSPNSRRSSAGPVMLCVFEPA